MSNEKILIVEDEIIVAMGIEQKLIDLGYDVVDIIDTGENAVKRAGQLKPDLILMDIVLKGEMDGVEAAQQIHDELDIPIIYLTAYSDKDILKRAQMTEPYGYMIKPFRKSEVNAYIEVAIYKHKSEKRKSEDIKRKILADYYDFVLEALPQYAENSEQKIKVMLLNNLENRFEEELRPNFEKEMNKEVTDDPTSLFNAYTTWLSDLFSSFGIRNKTTSDKQGYCIEFLNCPWKDEAKKKPVFCLNCQALINRSFSWTEFEGTVEQQATIANGSSSCIFKLY